MEIISLSNVSKSFRKCGKINHILNDINLKIDDGKFVILFGPNGSGKTTLLNLIAGILKLDNGEVLVNGSLPSDEKIGYVFQNYRDSLLPWKSNLDNISFPMELEGMPKGKRQAKAEEILTRLDINIPLNNFPYQSSGGEQQMVAILREIMFNPNIILMDEPFSALNHENREFLRLQLQEIWKKTRISILFVTHDINEAIQLADEIIILNPKKKNISCILSVNFQRPRTEDIFYTDEFRVLKKKLLSIVRDR